MQRHSRTGTGQRIHLRGIAELLFDRRRRPSLNELPEARPGVGEAPRRNLNSEAVQCAPHILCLTLPRTCTIDRHHFAPSLDQVLQIRNILSIETFSRIYLSGRIVKGIFSTPLFDQNHIQKPRPMHTFDPRHLDVRRGRRSRDKRSRQSGRSLQSSDGLGHGLDNILNPHHTQVIVRYQRHRPASLPGNILQHNGACLCNRQSRSRHHAVNLVQLDSCQFIVDQKLNTRRQPLLRQPTWDHHAHRLALLQHGCCSSPHADVHGLHYARIIVLETIHEQLQYRLARSCRLAPIVPGHRIPFSPRHISAPHPALGRTNPLEHLSPRRICNHVSCHFCPASPTSRETSPLASPRDLGSASIRPIAPATIRSNRPSEPTEILPFSPAVVPRETVVRFGRSFPSFALPAPLRSDPSVSQPCSADGLVPLEYRSSPGRPRSTHRTTTKHTVATAHGASAATAASGSPRSVQRTPTHTRVHPSAGTPDKRSDKPHNECNSTSGAPLHLPESQSARCPSAPHEAPGARHWQLRPSRLTYMDSSVRR